MVKKGFIPQVSYLGSFNHDNNQIKKFIKFYFVVLLVMALKNAWYGTGGMLPCSTDIISLPRSPGNLSQHQCCPQCHILQTPKLERYDKVLSESLNIYLTEVRLGTYI